MASALAAIHPGLPAAALLSDGKIDPHVIAGVLGVDDDSELVRQNRGLARGAERSALSTIVSSLQSAGITLPSVKSELGVGAGSGQGPNKTPGKTPGSSGKTPGRPPKTGASATAALNPSAAVLMTPEEVIAAAYLEAQEKRDAAETAVAGIGDLRKIAQVRDDALKPKPTTTAGRLIKAANNALERAEKIKAGGGGDGRALRVQGVRKSGGAKTSKKNKNEFMKGGYSAQEAEAIMAVDDFGGAATGASAVLLGSLMGVTAQTVRTIELRAIAKLKKPSRMGLVMPFVDKTTRDAIEQAAFGDEEFATALASAVERADERAGGGRVFGAFAGGAVASFGVSGGNTRGSETAPKKRRRSAQRRQAIGRQAKSKSTLKERGVARGDNAEATARDTVRKTATVRAV